MSGLKDFSEFISNGEDIDFSSPAEPETREPGEGAFAKSAVANLAEYRAARFVPRGPLALDPRAYGFDLGQTPAIAPRVSSTGSTFAVIDIVGPLLHHQEKAPDGPFASLMKCPDSYDAIKSRFAAACSDVSLTHVLLNIDCPGGLVAGCFDTVDEIRKIAADSGKIVWAYVDAQATSGGYALACAASRIFVPKSGIVGSIGVIDMLGDQTALDRAMGLNFVVITSGTRKADGNPHVSVSEDSVAAAQRIVDALSAQFHELVASHRGISAETVKGFECGLFCGQEAVDARLADEIATYDQVVAMLAASAEKTPETGIMNGDAQMTLSEHKAALKSIADDKDANDADREEARKMLASAEAPTDKKEDVEKKEEEKPEASAKSEAPPEDHKEPDEDDKKEEPKASATSSSLAMAARLQKLERIEAKRTAETDRSRLMASRPDFSSEVVAFLNGVDDLDTVRKACAKPENGGLPLGNGKSGQVGAARAALSVSATIPSGVNLGAPSLTAADPEDDEISRRMGLSVNKNPIVASGTKLSLGVMTREQAVAHLATKRANEAALSGVK